MTRQPSYVQLTDEAWVYADEFYRNDADFNVRRCETFAAGRKRSGQRYGPSLLVNLQ